MDHIKILRQKYPLHRFWELFIPTVLNFGFWLASASFWFFSYQSVLPNRLETLIEWICGVLSATFLCFGIMCLAILAYLAITWILGIRITRKKSREEEIVSINDERCILIKRLKELEMRLRDIEGEIITSIDRTYTMVLFG